MKIKKKKKEFATRVLVNINFIIALIWEIKKFSFDKLAKNENIFLSKENFLQKNIRLIRVFLAHLGRFYLLVFVSFPFSYRLLY